MLTQFALSQIDEEAQRLRIVALGGQVLLEVVREMLD